MKKIIGILVVLFILTAGIPSYFWTRTDNALSETRFEKLRIDQQLKTSQETLVATREMLANAEATLTVTKEALGATLATAAATQEKLAKTEQASTAVATILAATQTKLAAALNETKRLQAAVGASEEKLTETRQEKNQLKNRLASTDPVLSLPPPKYKGTMDYSLLASVLRNKFPESHPVLRTSVKLVPRQDWELFAKTDLTNDKPYSLQDFNCTEYATILQGKARAWAPASAFGIAVVQRPGIDQSGYSHYLNFLITAEGEILLLEPQNDQIFSPPEEWRYILLLM